MRKNPITFLLLSMSLLLHPLLADETENPTAKLLREALFAEQADRDLAQAEKGYREIIKNFETDRAYAATAILRLAEILHQRGATAEAEKWFARVLQEFPDQEAIAKVATARLGDKAAALLGERPDRIDPQTEEIARLTKLLEQSPDLLNTPIDGTTPLATAAGKGQLEVVEFLLTKGAQVNDNTNSSSALIAAVENGHLDLVARLLKAEAKLESGLLHKAVRSGNYAVSELLLKAGAEVNAAHRFPLPSNLVIDSSDKRGGPASRQPEGLGNGPSVPNYYVEWTPLEIATFFRFTKLTDLLLANGAKPQKLDGQFTEDLRFAIIDQDEKLVAELIENGADPNSLWNGFSALAIAASLENVGIVNQLIKAGSNLELQGPYGFTPIFIAKGAAVDILLDAGANPNAKANKNLTPLHQVEDPAKAKALLAAGADVDAISEDGFSPLVRANFEVLDVLLTAKPDLAKIANEETTLGLVAKSQEGERAVKRIEKLIAAGADPNQVDKNGMTPLLIAISSGSVENVKALLVGGGNPNGAPQSPIPLTLVKPLGRPWSARFGKFVRSLVDAGADPNVLDEKNESVLVKAALYDDLDLVRYLLEKGATLEAGGKFAFAGAPDNSATKIELFLATYLQSDRRHGTIRVVAPGLGRIYDEVSAFIPDGEKLPECPYTILEAYAFSSEENLSFGEVTIWREGKIEPLKIDLRKIIASGDPARDLKLAWGDLIQFSVASSEAERTVSETEKKFLEDHLHRQVQLTLEGQTNQVDFVLVCVKIPDSDLWIVRKDRSQYNYIEGNLNFPFRLSSVNDLKLIQQLNRNSEKFILEIQAVERGGRKIEIPDTGKSTLWVEPEDIIFLQKRAQ